MKKIKKNIVGKKKWVKPVLLKLDQKSTGNGGSPDVTESLFGTMS